MKNQKTMGNKGFSLVELIVVIAIMAVLVGVLAPQFIKYVENSRVSTDMQNVEQLKTAVEVAMADFEGTGSATISINTTDKKVTASVPSGVVLSSKTEIALKSKSWTKATTYTLNTSTGAWTGSADGDDKIDSVFGL